MYTLGVEGRIVLSLFTPLFPLALPTSCNFGTVKFYRCYGNLEDTTKFALSLAIYDLQLALLEIWVDLFRVGAYDFWEQVMHVQYQFFVGWRIWV